MEPTSEAFFTAAFGKEIAKTLSLSAAATVGMIAGIAAVVYVVTKVQDRQTKTSE